MPESLLKATGEVDKFYWCKTGTFKWFNLIANVVGEAPFLKVYGWDLFKRQAGTVSPDDITEWGAEIENVNK